MLLPVVRFVSRGFAWVLLLCVSSAVPAAALTVHHSYRFDASRLETVSQKNGVVVRAPGLASTWELNQPELPYEQVTLLVPLGSRPIAVRAQVGVERVLMEGMSLAAAAPIANSDGKVLQPPAMRAAASIASPVAEASYPARRAEIAGVGALHGYQMVTVLVYPVRYEPEHGRLVVTEHMELELDIAPGGPLPLERQRWRSSIEATAIRTLEKLVANPEAIPGYERRIGTLVEKPRGGFAPTDAPSLEGSDVDYVIITSNALASSWQVLANWKTRRGVPTVVRTTEWIQANYRHGSDVQETIRRFIQDAYTKWGVQYVLLGGDTDVLPARYGWSNFGEPTEREIPTDSYFACLDGNWNQDGDATWGEAAISASDPGDSTDFYAEVFVGRLPLSTVSDVSAFVTKTILYENPTQFTYQNKALLLGEVLFPVDWDSGTAISMDGGSFCEEQAGFFLPCVTTTRLYENFYDYPGSTELTRAAAIAAMNTGPGFVNHIGHGYRYSMSCGDVSFQNNNAEALTNTNKHFVLYMLNCTAGAFDYPCLAEAFLKSDGGAVAILGATRAAYALPSREYNTAFTRAVYVSGFQHLGEAFVESRIAQTPNAWFDTAHHYSHLLYNYLGDPELVMNTCGLATTAASYPASIGLGTTNILVHVTAGGSPHEGALVCLQKGTEEYEFGVTDVDGDVTIPFRAETAGSVQVTVTAQNIRTHLGSISVSNTAVAYVSVQSLSVSDDNTGASSGNSDGVIDAGETIELSTTFVNSGTVTANGVTGKLRIPSAWVTVPDSVYSLGTVNGGNGTASATNQVNFTIDAATPDGTVLPLTFVTTNGTSTWTDVVLRVVHAPVMQLVLLDVDDFAPGGNNDGIIQAGETFDLVTYVKNFGTGAADVLQASLSSTDPDVTIFNGIISLGRADAMEQVQGATRFRLRETVLAANSMTILLADSQARTDSWTIDLRGPAAPTVPVLDASAGAGVISVSWTPSVEADHAGYHVYRALAPGGPWTRASLDATKRVAYYRDTGLSPSTRYYYYATVVDDDGNESAPSPAANINTNPAQLAGWPIGLAASSSCPVVIGDITGDGSKEIIAGNDNLYAWNSSGLELHDDDGDPQTWGVFVTEINVINGAVALGELDLASPGFEVFVTSWEDSNKAFAVRGNGDFLPGWPVKPDPTSPQKGYWSASTAIDVDGDATAELWAAAKNGNLYAWKANGTPYLGASAIFKNGFGTFARTSPSFANLDGDPYREIVYGAPNGTLQIWNHDGSNYRSFPKTPGVGCFGNTAIGDVNKDGKLDVVMLTEGGAVNVYNTWTGNQLPGWPQSLSIKTNPIMPSPALADFNFDGFLEIVVANNHVTTSLSSVRIYDYQGNVLPGWPKTPGGYTSESSPIVADVSGDGVPDVLFGNEGGLLYGWNFNGTDLAGFPLTVGDFIRSTPFADDVDSDGSIDLVLSGWDKNVYIWDFPVPYNAAAAQWPTLKHDIQRSSYYGHRVETPTDVDPTDPPVVQAPPSRVFLAQNLPNPFNPVTTIRYGVPVSQDGGRTPVRIDIYDVNGRHVRRLVDGSHAAGNHQALWDGRDDRGRGVGSGVYFYRLQAGAENLTRKMMLLK